MTNNKFPSFTIICPCCDLKQTGFLKDENVNIPAYWECIICKASLGEDRLNSYLGQTVGDIKPKA